MIAGPCKTVDNEGSFAKSPTHVAAIAVAASKSSLFKEIFDGVSQGEVVKITNVTIAPMEGMIKMFAPAYPTTYTLTAHSRMEKVAPTFDQDEWAINGEVRRAHTQSLVTLTL